MNKKEIMLSDIAKLYVFFFFTFREWKKWTEWSLHDYFLTKIALNKGAGAIQFKHIQLTLLVCMI